LHDPRGLGLLPILENFVISLVAHDILHLRSAPTVKQLRSIVDSSELTIVSKFLQRIKLEPAGGRISLKRAALLPILNQGINPRRTTTLNVGPAALRRMG
jgi:hypothetical protein